MYQTKAYDQAVDGFPSEPVAVVVATGTHDVSRLLHLFAGGLIEHVQVGQQLQQQVRRRNGGRAALALLKQHGGPDLTQLSPDDVTSKNVAYWGESDRFVTAAPDGRVKVCEPQFLLKLDNPQAARQLADQLWAAADHAEQALANQVVSEPAGMWKACTDPEHVEPVDDTLDTCPEHDLPLVPVTAGGYEVVR